MDQEQVRPRRRRGRAIGSWLLFGAAIVVLVIAGVVYYRDQQAEPSFPPPPPSQPGRNEMVHVVGALRDQGLDTEYVRSTARAETLTEAGQGATVEGIPLYIFIYSDVASREAESADLDPSEFSIANTAGTPVSGEPVHLFAGSNVIAALFGGSTADAARVNQAIEALP